MRQAQAALAIALAGELHERIDDLAPRIARGSGGLRVCGHGSTPG
jgi:predicted DNA-binding protein